METIIALLDMICPYIMKLGAGAGITANNTQTQSSAVSPQSDANTLRNFQVLYRHAVHGCKIETDYRIPNILLSGRFLPDPFFLQLPHCVLCAAPSKQGRFIDDLGSYRPRVNSELTPAAWLYWRNDVGVASQEKPPSDESFVDLGHYGRHELFMTKRDFEEGVLTKFVFFFLPNSQPNEVFNQKADISLPEPRQDKNPPKDAKNRPQLQSITPSASSHVTPSAPYIVTPSAPATNQRFTPTSQAPLIPFVITPPFQ